MGWVQPVKNKVQCRAVVNKMMNQNVSLPCTYRIPRSEIIRVCEICRLSCSNSKRRSKYDHDIYVNCNWVASRCH